MRCQYCGAPLDSWDEEHTIEDCWQYLKTHNLKPYEWREKEAEKYNDERKAAMIVEEELRKVSDKLEAVREFVLSRRDDIEKDIEDFGILKPVLSHFLEEAEG